MKRALLTIALALAASSAFAQDAYSYRANGDCPPPPQAQMTHGMTGWQGWSVWQCRPAPENRLARRYFDVHYSFFDPIAYAGKLADFDPVLAAYKAGNTWGAQDLAKKLATLPHTDPLFAASKQAADAAIWPKLVANFVGPDGKACACDIRNWTLNGVLQCPRASDIGGQLVVCKGQ